METAVTSLTLFATFERNDLYSGR